MFNFQHPQVTQQVFEQLTELLLKYAMVCAVSTFDEGSVNSPLHLPLKPDEFFKNNNQVKYRFTYKIK